MVISTTATSTATTRTHRNTAVGTWSTADATRANATTGTTAAVTIIVGWVIMIDTSSVATTAAIAASSTIVRYSNGNHLWFETRKSAQFSR